LPYRLAIPQLLVFFSLVAMTRFELVTPSL
jgi:hypothetical protein